MIVDWIVGLLIIVFATGVGLIMSTVVDVFSPIDDG